jgi:carboxyl-terminal processing protease
MPKFNKKLIVPILLVFAIAIGFGAGLFIGKSSKSSLQDISSLNNAEINKPGNVDFSLFWDVWKQVESKYVDRSSLDPQKMIYGAISGMLTALGDPYTVFMPPDENKKFSESMKGEFGGIGAEVSSKNNIITIIAPLEGTPAKQAGLQPLDQIIKIDDKSTENLNVDEAVNLIRGPKGTDVKLMIMRDGWQEPKEFKITRDIITVPSMKWEMKDGDIAYIQLYQFTENITSEFEKAANEIANSNAKAIVLDMRGNPGGYLESANEIAGWFLPKGQLVVTEDSGNGKKNEYRTPGGEQKLENYPLVVLIDSGSASASEILAGALRDDKNVKLVGMKSFGKGSVQQLNDLSGGSSLKVTVAKWLTPSGKSIVHDGLDPDEKVEVTQDDIDNKHDPQLEKALEMVK